MPQFDVFRARGGSAYSLVVDIQADVHAKLSTRLVVPMVTRARYTQPATRLSPLITLGDEDYVALFPLAAAIPKASLGAVIGSLASQRATLIAALAFLITGS